MLGFLSASCQVKAIPAPAPSRGPTVCAGSYCAPGAPFFFLKIRPPEAVPPLPPAQRSEGWFTPSDQAIGSCSAGFTPSMPPMFTPNSFGLERRRWYM